MQNCSESHWRWRKMKDPPECPHSAQMTRMSSFTSDDTPEFAYSPQMTPLMSRWPRLVSTFTSDDPLNTTIWTSTLTSDDPLTPLNVHIDIRGPPECPHSHQMTPLSVHIHLRWPPVHLWKLPVLRKVQDLPKRDRRGTSILVGGRTTIQARMKILNLE